jgi:TetR/AcrR family transcriptional repressor of nem operon
MSYGAFGDKREFYLAALRLYIESNRQRLRASLAEGPAIAALSHVLDGPSSLLGMEDIARGCMVGNTATLLTPADDEATTLVRGAFDGFVDDVAEALGRAQAAGEVRSGLDTRAHALALLIAFQGAAVLTHGVFLDALRP